MKFLMLQIIQVQRLNAVKKCTKWRKLTKHLLTIVGSIKQTKRFLISRKERQKCLESSPWTNIVILESWHTLMPEKQLLRSVYSFIRVVFISWEKLTKVLPKWTGWSRSKNVELRSLLLRQQHNGMAIV